ncbi:MAG: DNA/RNA nuclease SfsA [Bdellovibrionales bacterium]
MEFESPLREAEFIKRYKRFFADVRVNGEIVVAHVPNTGSLKTCLFEGSPCLITESTNPARKLKATLHFLKTPSGWAGVNTSLPNLLVHHAWQHKRIPEWNEFLVAQREYKISKESRIDLVLARSPEELTHKRNLHHIEVKNVTLAEGDLALFPDAVTARGQKHLQDLMRLKAEGQGAEIVFVVQREGCRAFSPADAIDPVYGRLLREAHAAGVRIRVLACGIDPSVGITLNPKPLALVL